MRIATVSIGDHTRTHGHIALANGRRYIGFAPPETGTSVKCGIAIRLVGISMLATAHGARRTGKGFFQTLELG